MKARRTIISISILVVGILAGLSYRLFEVKTSSFRPEMVTENFIAYEEYENVKKLPNELSNRLNNFDFSKSCVVQFKLQIKNDSRYNLNSVNIVFDESKLKTENIVLIEKSNKTSSFTVMPKSANVIELYFTVPKNKEIKKIKSVLDSSYSVRYVVNNITYNV